MFPIYVDRVALRFKRASGNLNGKPLSKKDEQMSYKWTGRSGGEEA
jgi:hypothetical protein